MKKIRLFAALAAMVAVGCQQDFSDVATLQNETTFEEVADHIRSYDEALAIAEKSIDLLESKDNTRTTKRRAIKGRGETVRLASTRSGVASDDPVVYIFNFEDNAGFSVVAADERHDPIVAVTESGNYTYGEPTGVDAFDEYMNNTIEVLSIILPPIIDPITPTPGYIVDSVDIYNRVEPLLTTKWGQYGIYGISFDSGSVACATVATGQLVAFHKKPAVLQMTGTNNLFLSIPWTNILRHDNSFSSAYSETDCDCGCNYLSLSAVLYEIAYRHRQELIDLGVTGPWVTGPITGIGTDQSTLNVLRELGYSNATLVSNISWNDNSIKNKIYDNLDVRRPLYIAGGTPPSSHAWVIDGYHEEAFGVNYYVANPNYDPRFPVGGEPEYIFSHSTVERTELLHNNWGYGGACDGWFNYGVFDTSEAEEYDQENINLLDYNFLGNYGLIYNIYYL